MFKITVLVKKKKEKKINILTNECHFEHHQKHYFVHNTVEKIDIKFHNLNISKWDISYD